MAIHICHFGYEANGKQAVSLSIKQFFPNFGKDIARCGEIIGYLRAAVTSNPRTIGCGKKAHAGFCFYHISAADDNAVNLRHRNYEARIGRVETLENRFFMKDIACIVTGCNDTVQFRSIEQVYFARTAEHQHLLRLTLSQTKAERCNVKGKADYSFHFLVSFKVSEPTAMR